MLNVEVGWALETIFLFHIHTWAFYICDISPYTTSIVEMLVSHVTLLLAVSSVRSAHTVNINIQYNLSQLAHTVGNVSVHKKMSANATDRNTEKQTVPQKHPYMIG